MKYAKLRCDLCGTLSDSVEEVNDWFTVYIQSNKDYVRNHYYSYMAPKYNYNICPGCF